MPQINTLTLNGELFEPAKTNEWILPGATSDLNAFLRNSQSKVPGSPNKRNTLFLYRPLVRNNTSYNPPLAESNGYVSGRFQLVYPPHATTAEKIETIQIHIDALNALRDGIASGATYF